MQTQGLMRLTQKPVPSFAGFCLRTIDPTSPVYSNNGMTTAGKPVQRDASIYCAPFATAHDISFPSLQAACAYFDIFSDHTTYWDLHACMDELEVRL